MFMLLDCGRRPDLIVASKRRGWLEIFRSIRAHPWKVGLRIRMIISVQVQPSCLLCSLANHVVFDLYLLRSPNPMISLHQALDYGTAWFQSVIAIAS